MPDKQPRRGPDMVGIIGLVAVLGVLLAAYLVFPWVQRQIGYQDCIASGRITGC